MRRKQRLASFCLHAAFMSNQQLVISPDAAEALREIDRDGKMSEERRAELYHKIQAGLTGRVTKEQLEQIREAHRSRSHDAATRVYDEARRKHCRKCLPSSMPNESKASEEYVSDALALMVKARWVKQYGQSTKGLRVDWTDRGKLAMDALGYVIEDLGPESLNQQLWWAVGTLAAVRMMP
jgi:hypothetical protein